MKFVFACLLLAGLAQGQSMANTVSADQNIIRLAKPERANLLRELDSSLEQMVSKVSPVVVQICGGRTRGLNGSCRSSTAQT